MVFAARIIKAAPIYVRRFSTTPVNRNEALARMRKIQADFQLEDGKPVWLKGGMCDRILYSLVWIGIAIGVPDALLTIYGHAKPPSWKEKD